ncbi:helix-turn-helix domain-containing protein [Gracilibacillus alcaliphilus]|uniref:helix-turn-helix domain-containing protein n=1 Tax=Gracilibacillus alcaliphilus TaxID=1401441 RepID=UPI00195771FE|nr:helix-turn-helix domain-containing protein [Gracilibacillus alcaliphilus]MBM7677184.1 YesN/AraC family two-component response regulator [Gracilibacillus alcaliphilus]
MKRQKTNKVFRRFLVSYLIILILPLIAGLISYQVSLDTAEKYSIMNSKQVLNKSREILEQKLEEIDRFVIQLSLDNDLNTILNKPGTDERSMVSILRQLDSKISPYASTNEFLEDFYIYSKESELIITPGSVFHRPHHFYASKHYENMSMSDWEENILKAERKIIPSKRYIKGETLTNIITYVQPLPMNDFTGTNGSIIVPIDNKLLNNVIKGINEQFNGWAFILDENKQLITANGIDMEEINSIREAVVTSKDSTYLENDILLISSQSEKNDWIYVAGIPKEVLVQEAAPIKYITWSITSITFIIGLIICLVFAYRNSHPINNVIKTLKEYADPETKNEYDFLHGNVTKLISTNSTLQKQLREQKPLLKDAFIKQLLSGEINERDSNLHDNASQANVDIDYDNGYVAIVKVEGYEELTSREIYEELNALRVVIQQESLKLCDKFHVTNFYSDKLIYIFLTREDKELLQKKIDDMFKQLTQSLQTEYRILLKIGLGQSFQSISDISRSYNEAKQAIDYAHFSTDKQTLYWYDDLMKETTVFYYPLEFEFRLLKCLKDGEAIEAEEIIKELLLENMENRNLSMDMYEQFIYEVRGTFYKILDQYIFRQHKVTDSIRKRLRTIKLEEGRDEMEQQFIDVIHLYCGFIKKNRKDTNNTVINEIKRYVDQHYQETELTIYMIAEHLSRTEKYISQIFKEETGEYLYEYLEKVRMEKAIYLLTNTTKTINAIAEESGYSSAHSFRRAFKRIYNMTPNQFRKTVNDPKNFKQN